jgi:hypothetical protein
MFERLLNTDALTRVEGKKAIKKVQSIWVGAREQLRKRDLGHVWQITHILLCTRRTNPGKRCFRWRTQEVQNLIQLVNVVATFEERFATKQLGENAADRPDIN